MRLLAIPWLVLLASCGPSQEEKENVALITCSIMSETRNMDAAVRVREINEAREKIGGEPFLRGDDVIKEALEADAFFNEADAFFNREYATDQFHLCKALVLNENYDETLQSLKDAIREEERIAAEKRAEENRIAAEKRAEENRIAAEKQRIADSKPSVIEEFYSSGGLKSRKNYQPRNEEGKKDGLWEHFYENGQLWERINYKDGKLDGSWEWFYENGQLSSTTNYKDGELDGLSEFFDEDGNLTKTETYKDGELVEENDNP